MLQEKLLNGPTKDNAALFETSLLREPRKSSTSTGRGNAQFCRQNAFGFMSLCDNGSPAEEKRSLGQNSLRIPINAISSSFFFCFSFFLN
jgi:hypothetical protein